MDHGLIISKNYQNVYMPCQLQILNLFIYLCVYYSINDAASTDTEQNKIIIRWLWTVN